MLVPTHLVILLVSVAGLSIIGGFVKVGSVKSGSLPPYNYVISFATGFFVIYCALLVVARWQTEIFVEGKATTFTHFVLEGLCVPITFFYIGYSINLNFFKHSKMQVFTIGISATLIQAVLLTFLLDKTGMYEEFPTLCLMFISTICLPYTSSHSIELLKNSTVHTKHLEQLLEGEGFVSTISAILLLNFVNIGDITSKSISATEIIARAATIAKGCVIGMIGGVLVRPVVTHVDEISFKCFTVGALFFPFFFLKLIQEHILETTFVALGIATRSMKRLSDQKCEADLDKFWAWKFYAVEYLVFFTSGIKSVFRTMDIFDDALKAFIMYFFTILLRGLNWLCTYYLTNVLFRFTIPCKVVFICIFAAYKSTPPLLLAFDRIAHTANTKYSNRIESIVALFVCFHCLFSSFFVPLLCTYSGLTDFSKKRLSRINNLLERITNQKQKTIENLQVNIISANANWQIVDYLTKIYKPETKITTVEHLIHRRDRCLKELPNSSTTDEESCQEENNDGLFERMQKRTSQDLLAKGDEMDRYLKNSIRKKMLEMETISCRRQFSEEIISKKTHLYLTNIRDTPTLEESWKIKKRNWTSSYNSLARIQSQYQDFKRKPLKKPVNGFRSSLFNVITSPSYKLFITTIIVLDSLAQLLLVYFYYSEALDKVGGPTTKKIKSKNIYADYLQSTDYFCYGLFLGEFFFQILGWGCVQYFEQKIWFIEFSVSIIIRSIEQLLLHAEIKNEQPNEILKVSETIILLKSMLILRLVVLQQYFQKSCFSYIKDYIEYWKNSQLMKTYEKKYGMAICNNDILQHYQNIFGSTPTGRKLKQQWLKIRSINKTHMSLLEGTSNEIAVAMKSKHVAVNVLKDSELHIKELKQTGQVLEFENWILERNLNKIQDDLKNITKVAPPQPAILLQQVYWLRGDHACRNYLLNHAEMVKFKAQECIIDFGEETAGLFLIISGICKYFYKPTVESLFKLLLLGKLPNSDYFLHLRFNEVQKDIIDPGNLIGEFGLITGRRSNVRVRCESDVRALKIPYPPLIKLFYKCHFGSIRLAKIWKTIGIRFCIKHFIPYFKILSRENLILRLHKSVVPLSTNIKLVNINDDISEVILIEGKAKDSLTRRHLFAPLFIELQGQKLIVNYETIPNDIPTRLMLIPKQGVNLLDIVRSNEVFKDYLQYSTFVPKLLGEDLRLKARSKIKIIREFLKKHKKYMLIDFMLQVNDPKIGIPCCIGKKNSTKIKRKKRALPNRTNK